MHYELRKENACGELLGKTESWMEILDMFKKFRKEEYVVQMYKIEDDEEKGD